MPLARYASFSGLAYRSLRKEDTRPTSTSTGNVGRSSQRRTGFCMAFVAWLSTALFAASCTQTARARLLQSVTARRLAAVATVFAQLVLQGLNPCLEVEEEGSQLPHQGQHGFFALHVGDMNIVSGR